jgi:hypothetical protein
MHRSLGRTHLDLEQVGAMRCLCGNEMSGHTTCCAECIAKKKDELQAPTGAATADSGATAVVYSQTLFGDIKGD